MKWLLLLSMFLSFDSRADFSTAFWNVHNVSSPLVLFDAVGPGAAGTNVTFGNSLSWTHTCSGTNRVLLVGVAVGADPTTGLTLSVTYNGVAMTQAALEYTGDDTNGNAQLFYLVNPATGPNTVQVTVTGGSGDLEAGSVSFTNVNQSAPIRNTALTNSPGSANPSIQVTSASTDMVVDVLAAGSAVTSSGTTLRWMNNNSDGTGGGNGAQSTANGASSVTMNYVISSDEWALIATSLMPASLSPPALPTQLVVTSAPQSTTTWTCSAPTAIQLKNGSNQISYFPNATTTINLSGNFYFFSDPNCTVPITSMTLWPGQSTATVYWEATAPGSEVLTASATGLTSGTQTETITIVPFTWIGGAGCSGNWPAGNGTAADQACWQGGSLPGTGQTAQFDQNCTINCTATLTGSIDVGAIWMHPGAGAISQSVYTITTENSFEMDGGIFEGGSAPIIDKGPFILTGGSFTSTSDNATGLQLQDSVTVTGGSFTHNSGLLAIGGSGNSWIYIAITGSLPAYNVTYQQGEFQESRTTGTLVANGNFIMNNSTNFPTGNSRMHGTGTIAVKGNVTASWGEACEGTDCATISVAGSGSQTIFGNGGNGCLPALTIASTGSVILDSTNPICVGGNLTYTSGAVTTTNSTVMLSDNPALTFQTISTGSLVFNNFNFSKGGGSTANTIVGTLYTSGAVSWSNTGATYCLGGTIDVAGNMTTVAGNSGCAESGVGDTAVNFSGAGNQNFDYAHGAPPNGGITINKTGGTVTMTGNVVAATPGETFQLLAGTLDLNGKNFTGSWTPSVASGATVRAQGGETVTTTGGITFSPGSFAVYYGNGSTTYPSLKLGTTYDSVTFNNAGNTWKANGNVTVNKNLTVTAGTFDANGHSLTVGGNIASTGTLTNSGAVKTLGFAGTAQSFSPSLPSARSIRRWRVAVTSHWAVVSRRRPEIHSRSALEVRHPSTETQSALEPAAQLRWEEH